ncbi:MAG: hypothetical protein J6S47_05855 [Eubacteriaceae bacterium]|nr:hypothetical protein [Eubacteriaceae bacterium]
MKKILSILLLTVMLISVAACGSGGSSNKEDVVLTAWYYADPGASEGYDLWAQQVHEKYPYITIEFEELPYDNGPEKFTVAVANDSNPDFYFDV